MSLMDDCDFCGGECIPWRCPNCGEPNCSFHEETCGECGFPRLHRFRDMERRAKLEDEVREIFGKWKHREGA